MKYWVVDVMDELESWVYPVWEDRVFTSEDAAKEFASTIVLRADQDIDVYWVTMPDLEDIWGVPIKIKDGFVKSNI